jgi:ubiquinol-cytochrome c reductase cytochrome b subunit
VFFYPNLLGDPENYNPANPLTTPAEIKPEWYFWPFYAILRSFTYNFLGIPAKLWGVLAMFSSILVLFFLPWLDTSPVRSAKYRPAYRAFFWILVIDVLVLGFIGGQPVTKEYALIGQVAAAWYFIHFLLILPIVSMMEKPRPLPNSITEAVLSKKGGSRMSETAVSGSIAAAE